MHAFPDRHHITASKRNHHHHLHLHQLQLPTKALLLPPLSADISLRPVPDLIHYFEGLDTTIEESSASLSSSSSRSSNMSRIPAPPFPSPFSALRLSLTTTFNRPPRAHTSDSMNDSSANSSTTTSASASPQSSLRGTPFPRSRTWTSHAANTSRRGRSCSPQSMRSYHTHSPVLLRRQPSSVDIDLLEEESLTSHDKAGVGLGLLSMMEPRPVRSVAVAVPASSGSDGESIFASLREEEMETRQPFVMGGILEVMEGKA